MRGRAAGENASQAWWAWSGFTDLFASLIVVATPKMSVEPRQRSWLIGRG
jgi:hypothetical protein